jgi:hypothetical protein
MDLLMTVQVDEMQVTFFMCSPFNPGESMVNVEFHPVEERDSALWAHIILVLGELSFTR